MSSDFNFVVCTNPQCRLRFPLDLGIYEGKFCPKCGSLLSVEARANPSVPGDMSLKPVKIPIAGLLDNLRSVHNVGSIFRSADGAGFSPLYLCGITPTPTRNPEITKTALGSEDSVEWSYHPNSIDLAVNLKDQGFRLITLERTEHSLPIQHCKINQGDRLVVIVGNEPAGVDPALIGLSDDVVSLPMLGTKESLNAAISFSIAAYWLRLSSD